MQTKPQEVDPAAQEMAQSYAIAAALAVALIGLSIAGAAFVRLRATTDPRKLAESDPWLRARLRQLGKTCDDLDDLPPAADPEPAAVPAMPPTDPSAVRPARD